MAYRLLGVNNKGGVGRTTEAIGLAWAVAKTGRRVLVITMDPQGDIDDKLGITQAKKAELIAAGNRGISGVLDPRDPTPMADVVVPCGWDDPTASLIDVIPSMAMSDLEDRGKESHLTGAVGRLSRALKKFDDSSYHLVIIDVGPTAGHLFDMSVVAADWVLVVVLPDKFGVAGAQRVIAYLQGITEILELRPRQVVGYVVSNEEDSSTHRFYGSGAGDVLRDPWTGGEITSWGNVPHSRAWNATMSRCEPPSKIGHPAGADLRDIYEKHATNLIEAGI